MKVLRKISTLFICLALLSSGATPTTIASAAASTPTVAAFSTLTVSAASTTGTPSMESPSTGSPAYRLAVPCQFDDSFTGFRDDVAPVKLHGKFGLIDKYGNTVAPFVYDSIGLLSSFNSLAAQSSCFVVVQNYKSGIIDKSGKPLVPCKYDAIVSGGNGRAIVGVGKAKPPGLPCLDGLWGIVDIQTGREILPVTYRDISPADDFSLYTVNINNKQALVDAAGKTIVPTGTYDYITCVNSGYITVQKKGKFGVINKSGRLVIPLIYDRIDPFWSGVALAIKAKKYGVLNTAGKTIVPFNYGDGAVYRNGVIRMRSSGKTIVFDRTGKVIAPLGKYDYVLATTGNLIYVERGGKVGAIDMTGREVVPFIYSGVREAVNGITVVTADDKNAVINQNGKLILPLGKYGSINIGDINTNDGCVHVMSMDSKWGLLDYNGNTVLPCEYSSIGNMQDGYVVAQSEQGSAIFNLDGTMVVPFGAFEYFGKINENSVPVTKNGLTGFIILPEYVAQPDPWAHPEIERAIAAGLVPVDLRKNYQANIARADFCRLAITMIEVRTGMKIEAFMNTRGMAGRVSDPIAFTDTDDPYVKAASRLGIVNGVGKNRFNPDGFITRQDAAVMLYQTASVLELGGPSSGPALFTDSSQFAGYAVYAIGFVSTHVDKETGNKIMGGTGDNKFSPLSPYTRQQAYITILRLYNI